MPHGVILLLQHYHLVRRCPVCILHLMLSFWMVEDFLQQVRRLVELWSYQIKFPLQYCSLLTDENLSCFCYRWCHHCVMSRGENIVSADDVDTPMGELGTEMPLSTVYCRPPPTKPPLEAQQLVMKSC